MVIVQDDEFEKRVEAWDSSYFHLRIFLTPLLSFTVNRIIYFSGENNESKSLTRTALPFTTASKAIAINSSYLNEVSPRYTTARISDCNHADTNIRLFFFYKHT